MTFADYLEDVSLPPAIRSKAQNYLASLTRADDAVSLRLAIERAVGFVEGVDAARALTAASIESLFIVIDTVASVRRGELEA